MGRAETLSVARKQRAPAAGSDHDWGDSQEAFSPRSVFRGLESSTTGSVRKTVRTRFGAPISRSVWWVQLGIKPERIQRGKPTQNGRHERMHRTLKADAIRSEARASSRFAQQRVFDHFRTTFNSERPHEALSMKTPATLYVASSRQYPRDLQSPAYPEDWQVQRVRRDGSIRLGDKDITVSTKLRGEPAGIEYQDDGGCKIHYGPLHLAGLSKSERLTRGMRPKKAKPSEHAIVEENESNALPIKPVRSVTNHPGRTLRT